jgi:hypothetical protein
VLCIVAFLFLATGALAPVGGSSSTSSSSDSEQAVALGSTEDPADYYEREVASHNPGYFEKTLLVFEKCAAVKGNLQGTCTTAAQQSKKEAVRPSPR